MTDTLRKKLDKRAKEQRSLINLLKRISKCHCIVAGIGRMMAGTRRCDL